MAGAGKKTFVAGEVLTAAQVNDYLMDQAVMRFSGSAARAASITVPTEGMVTYLDDRNRLEIYDGSAWVIADPSRLITASQQILVGSGSGSMIAVSPTLEGQVLTAASAQPGGVAWVSPSGAGRQAFATVTATSTNTALSSSLTPGFYKITTDTTTSWNSSQFRFVDTDGYFYGASLTSGTGLFTIPVNVASINLTTGTMPIRVIVEELSSITATLLAAPTLTSFSWNQVNAGSLALTPPPTSACLGYFQVDSGSFFVVSAPGAATTLTGASIVANGTLGASYEAVLVSQSSNGLWGTASPRITSKYPYQVFTANGTYTKPAWSASADVLVVSGGGGGGQSTFIPASPSGFGRRGGGGGAGGASLFTNVLTPAPVGVTIGGGGSGAATVVTAPNGTSSSFGSLTTAGGGGGGAGGVWPTPDVTTAGNPGGSGGGGGGQTFPTAATGQSAGGNGTPGQGFGGAPGSLGSGGGGVAGAGASAGGSGSVTFGVAFGSGGWTIATTASTRGSGGAITWTGPSAPIPSNTGLNGVGGMVIVRAIENA